MNLTNRRFVHLHVHTEYSLLDSSIRIPAMLEKAKADGMPAVAITDHGNMFGVVDFYEQAKKIGVKPIIGCECYVTPRTLHDKTPEDHKEISHLVLLAENQEGYKNLCALTTQASLEGFYHRPRIDKQILAKHSKGLIGLSGCLKGEIPSLIRVGKIKEADNAARFYLDLFGKNNFFLEVQNSGILYQEIVNRALLEMHKRLSIPMVATNDCHYLNKSDAKAHDVLLCIQTGSTVEDSNRLKFNSEDLYFKSSDEMIADFGGYTGAIENTLVIADRCHVEFDFKTFHLPKFDSNSEKTETQIFEEKVGKGYAEKMEIIRRKNPGVDESAYKKRIDYEISVINVMGFPAYFLIVADLVEYAKNKGIAVGPGRGSAAGSLVVYSLGITDLDPIEHGLIFERFYNSSRVSMPDIDIDFCINGRDDVYRYVVDRYGGDDYVAQIITCGKMKALAVIRDVGRALDIPLTEVDAIVRLIPDELNITIEKALEKEPKLRKKVESDPAIAGLIDTSKALEGLHRHASTHAAGIVIGDKPLKEYMPLCRGRKGETLTQFDMKKIEALGLVKLDFLRLRDLTIIADALKIIVSQGKTPPDISNLDLQDRQTYELLAAGDTSAVFLMESAGMKRLITLLKPQTFVELTALVALYRPGPMSSGMVEDYIDCKHGRKEVTYLVPELEEILKPTYGVMLYQEQVMKIAEKLAGYTLVEADGLRKDMVKKIPKVIAKQRKRFVSGAVKNNIPKEKVIKLFGIIEKYAGYGFNMPHSAAYALIAFQTAYLKAHFPVEYMAAVLTFELNSSESIIKYIADCRSHNISILHPDINESDKGFTVSGEAIRFGLAAVIDVSEEAIESIIKTRENGKYESLIDFCGRVDIRKVNKRTIESLIHCGALDSTGLRRSQMMASLEAALEYGQNFQKGKKELNPPAMPDIPEWDEKQKLEFEKEATGIYISGHPLDLCKDLMDKFDSTNSRDLKDESVKEGTFVQMGGIVRSIETITTKRGDPMAFVELEDIYGSIEIVVFTRVYNQVSDFLLVDSPVYVQGEFQRNGKFIKILAESIVPLA